MTSDLVALVRNQPDVRAVVEGMIAFGEHLEVEQIDRATHVRDRVGHLLASIEDPVLVDMSEEIVRLLGPEAAERVRAPVWWLEVRAAVGQTDSMRVARKFLDDLVHWQGGLVWSVSRGRPLESGEQQ
jgi:hypothetical protein